MLDFYNLIVNQRQMSFGLKEDEWRKMFNKVTKHGWTYSDDGYITKQLSPRCFLKVFYTIDQQTNEYRAVNIQYIDNQKKKGEVIKSNITTPIANERKNGSDKEATFTDLLRGLEEFYYLWKNEDIKYADGLYIPTDRELTEEEKQKIREICKSQNILNYEDISKYTNALKEFEDIYNSKQAVERDWQNFFQKHLWVLGLSLQQQLIIPSKPSGELKQNDIDASLMTSSNFRVIAEFKKHTENLLKDKPYRKRKQEDNKSLNDCYNVSDDVSGGVNQVLQYKQNIKDNFTNQKDETGKKVYCVGNFNPKCYLIIGNTTELDDDGKKECFELFRRNCKDVEIITYDEIYEKIKYVVDNMTDSNTEQTKTKEETNKTTDDYDDDIPF